MFAQVYTVPLHVAPRDGRTAIPDPRTARIRAFHHGITFDHIRTHAIIHNRVHPFVQSERSVPVLALENPLQNNDYGPIHFICV